MDVFTFFILFTYFLLDAEAFDTNCSSVKCSHGTPDIRYPFLIQGQQPQHCGHPGFELFCRQNQTTIHFPSYGDLVVKSISYDTKTLYLLDPKTCVHEVFLNLNLSHTPFRYYYVLKNYKYFNCSAKLSPSFGQVPCLSGSGYHVYVVEETSAMPVSCTLVKTIAIPFSYSPYLSDNSFGLRLTWDLTRCEDFEAKGGWCGFQSKLGLSRCFNSAHGRVASITILIFMVATLISVKTYYSKRQERQNFDKLLKYCETIKPAARNSNTDAKGMITQIETA